MRAADHVVAIDVSGSMRWDREGNRAPKLNGPSRIEIVRPALQNYVTSLPDESRLFLVSFNNGIVSEREFLLSRAGDRKAALAWVAALAPPGDSETHLFATIRRVLLKAREYAANSGEEWVNVRVITDGENDHKGSTLTLKEVLDGFPEIQKGLMLPDLILLGSMKTEFMGPVKELAEGPHPSINPILDEDFSGDPFPPVVKWAPSPAVAGQKITFFDASKSAFKTHRWFVDEVAVGEGKTIDHVFEKPGKYLVRLEVERQNGSRDKARQQVVVGTNPVKADFHLPSDVVAGRRTEFIDRSSGEVERSKWTIDGSVAGDERDLAFTFEKEGGHEVTLEVTGKTGQKDSTTRSVSVQPPSPPPAAPKAGIRMVGAKFKVGEPVQFMDQSSGLIEGYSWDFAGEATSPDKNPVHSFKTAGDKKVELIVRGPGGEARTSATLKIWPAAPTVSLAADKQKGTVPFDVRFAATIDGASNGITWDFGDGTTSAESNPVHSYQSPGQFTVLATVSFADTDGPGTVTAVPLTIHCKAPMPVWAKVLLGLAGLLALWVLVVVPLVLKPFFSLAEKRGGAEYRLKPERGSSTSMNEVFRSHGGTNWFWPRTFAVVGNGSQDDIRLAGAGSETLGTIRRIPFQNRFMLVPTSKGIIKQRKTALRFGQQDVTEIPVDDPTTIESGDEFTFRTVIAKWEVKT